MIWKKSGLCEAEPAEQGSGLPLSPGLMQWLRSPYAGTVCCVKTLTRGHLHPAQAPTGNLTTVCVTEVLEGQKSILRKANIQFCFFPFQSFAL